ncbi:hypothetical protein CJ255_11835 [Candidatus Viridilinea mediisalina]|uniref:Uncharacterized protein n=1 Tax=Candidatus Viridilinea mediisalina TaxID=2024553 RepID=A0A2A6RIR5_9CHLR|nr:hypothetical protein CJ255_11835 [Candidatus Viridilinea mediisalina]
MIASIFFWIILIDIINCTSDVDIITTGNVTYRYVTSNVRMLTKVDQCLIYRKIAPSQVFQSLGHSLRIRSERLPTGNTKSRKDTLGNYLSLIMELRGQYGSNLSAESAYLSWGGWIGF